MFVDPSGKGTVVYKGSFVCRPEVVHIGGSNGPEYQLNWRVDRIREGDVVLIREDPAQPAIPARDARDSAASRSREASRRRPPARLNREAPRARSAAHPSEWRAAKSRKAAERQRGRGSDGPRKLCVDGPGRTHSIAPLLAALRLCGSPFSLVCDRQSRSVARCDPGIRRIRTPQIGPYWIARSTVGLANPSSDWCGIARSQDAWGEIAGVRCSPREGLGDACRDGCRVECAALSVGRLGRPCGQPCARRPPASGRRGPGAAQIEIVGTGAPAYSVRVADGGRRLLVDLSDSDVVGAPAAITTPPASSAASSPSRIRRRRGQMTRLTVTLQREASYRVVPDGTTPPRAARRRREPRRPRPARQGRPALPAPRVDRHRPRHPLRAHALRARRAARSSGVRPRRRRPGQHPRLLAGAVVDGPPPARAPRRPRCPTALARTLDVTAYRGALKSITASQDAETHATVLEIDGSPETPGTLSVEGGTLVWTFPVPKSSAQAPPIAPHSHRRQGRRHATAAPFGRSSPWRASRRSRTCRGSRRRSTTRTRRSRPRAASAAGFASGDAGRARAAALHRPPHRHRPQGRRHPQRPPAPRRHRPREHRHRRRRHRDDHDPDAQRPVGPGARRRAPGQGPRAWCARATSSASRRWRSSRRSASSSSPSRSRSSSSPRSRRASSRSATRRPSELQARAKELLSPRGSIAVDERTNVLIARDVAGEPQLHRGARSARSTPRPPQVLIEARIVEATSKYSRDVGIQWGGDVDLRARRPATRPASPSRRASTPRAATTTTTPRPPASRPSRATSRPRTSPSTSRPPSAPGPAARSA